MNSYNYLTDKLEGLVTKHPSVRIRYVYEPEFMNHIVEVDPDFYYNNDLMFAKSESELCSDFGQKYYHTIRYSPIVS